MPLVAFILACLIFPTIVKNKQQYYAAIVAVLIGLLLNALGVIFAKYEFANVARGIGALVQIATFILLILATGGLRFKELASDMIEVMRRGDEGKEVIIPLSQQQAPVAPRGPAAEPPRQRYNLDEDKPKPDQSGSLPLE